MKRTIGERWIHYVGKQSLRHPLAPYIFVVLAILQLGVAIALIWMSIIHGQWSTVMQGDGLPLFGVVGMLFGFIAFGNLGLSLLYFERKQFYRIIDAQKKRIAELEA